jgi:hypothetical protein
MLQQSVSFNRCIRLKQVCQIPSAPWAELDCEAVREPCERKRTLDNDRPSHNPIVDDIEISRTRPKVIGENGCRSFGDILSKIVSSYRSILVGVYGDMSLGSQV